MERTMNIKQVSGGIEITECPSVKDLKAKIAQFVKLYERSALVEAQGWFTCQDSHDPVHLNTWKCVTVGTRLAVNLGSEGVALLGNVDMVNMRFRVSVKP
jgi:hypothetical protein